MITLSFPIDKSFYKSDNLFKHDFLLRRSLDDVDLLWYRTHDQEESSDEQRPFRSLDNADISDISRTIDSCPENWLEVQYEISLEQLTLLQQETELFDFYFEFFYSNSLEDTLIKDEMKLQKRTEIIRSLRAVETDELTCYYENFWGYVYEKSALKAIISPAICDPVKNIHCTRKLVKSGKGNSENSEITVKNRVLHPKQITQDDVSLMNARFVLQQLKEKGIEEDKLTYLNVCLNDDEDEFDRVISSSVTLSNEIEPSSSDGSRLTEISFEKEPPVSSADTSFEDPFINKSYGCLYYLARQIYDHLKDLSDVYFSEAPMILLENDLVIEMKERELNYIEKYNHIINQYSVKIKDVDGREGYNGRVFRKGLLRLSYDLVSNIETIKQLGVSMMNKTKKWDGTTDYLQRSPKVRLSDYRKLIKFDFKTEQTNASGQKIKMKEYKTAVCISGRTKLRRYYYCERITQELNDMKTPIQKVVYLSKIAKEHASNTINTYLEMLLRLIRKRYYFEDYPDDLFTKIRNSINNTTYILADLEELRTMCAEEKRIQLENKINKPLGAVRKYGKSSELSKETIQKLKSEFHNKSEKVTQICTKNALENSNFISGLNIINNQGGKPFKKSTVMSKTKNITENNHSFRNHSNFVISGLPKNLSDIFRRHNN